MQFMVPASDINIFSRDGALILQTRIAIALVNVCAMPSADPTVAEARRQLVAALDNLAQMHPDLPKVDISFPDKLASTPDAPQG